MSDGPRKPRAFDAAAAPQNDNPKTFVGKLVFFTGLEDVPRYKSFNYKLGLIFEEQKADSNEERDILLGYTINNPSSRRVRDLFNHLSNISIKQNLQFAHLLNGGIEGDSHEDNLVDLTTFLTKKTNDQVFTSDHVPLVHHFGSYSAYSCDSLAQLHEMAPFINRQQNALLVYNQFSVDRLVLERMIQRGNAYIRDASDDVIFYPVPIRRAAIAFPDIAPPFMTL